MADHERVSILGKGRYDIFGVVEGSSNNHNLICNLDAPGQGRNVTVVHRNSRHFDVFGLILCPAFRAGCGNVDTAHSVSEAGSGFDRVGQIGVGTFRAEQTLHQLTGRYMNVAIAIRAHDG